MQTLVLQLAVTVGMVTFAVLAAVAARLSAASRFGAGWGLAALAFGMSSATQLLQNTWGTWAFVEGAGSAPWNAYLRWAPALNHGRTLLLVAFNLFLMRLRPGRGSTGGLAGIAAGLCAAGVAGGLLGWWEGAFDGGARHYLALSLINFAWLVTALAALALVLLRESLDWMLWTALLVYAVAGAFDIVFTAGQALSEVLGGWAPSPVQRNALRLGRTVAMVGLALWACRRALHGVRTPSMGGVADRSSNLRRS